MAKIVENALVIYTDGSCQRKQGRAGGFGMVFLHYDELGNEVELDDYVAPSLKGTTNNRMELEACVTALKKAPDVDCYSQVNSVVIRTDSQYVTRNYFSALTYWRNSKWCNKDGKPVGNADLWKEFVRAFNNIHKSVEMQWVKAHGKGLQKDPHNYKADSLAKYSAANPIKRREYRSSVRRKLSPYETEVGSIKMHGQQILIRVIENERLIKVQRRRKYRCEVMSTDSPYYQCVDFLYSSADLRDGHTYEVILNNDPRNPTIAEVVREIVAETGSETL